MSKRISSNWYMKEEFPFWISRAEHGYHTGLLEVHGHDFVELVFVVRGEGLHCFEGDRYDIRAGDVFIINPGEEHTYAFEPKQHIEIINCLFMPSLIPDSLLRELEISRSMDYFYVHPFLNKTDRFNHRLNLYGHDASVVLALLESMIRELGHKSPGYVTVIRLQMIELLILLSRYNGVLQKEKKSPRQHDREMTARRICGYLERNYDQKIALSALADLFYVSLRQLNRVMKGEYGKSVIDILHEIRIARAKHLLEETEEKVIAVATMVGYEDPAFFSRLFARHVGCSPRKYRSGVS